MAAALAVSTREIIMAMFRRNIAIIAMIVTIAITAIIAVIAVIAIIVIIAIIGVIASVGPSRHHQIPPPNGGAGG